MRTFIYKSLVVFILAYLLIYFTIGLKIKEFKNSLHNFTSKSYVEHLKEKVRDEMRNAIKKDDYISKEDAILINNFLNKIKSDLNKN
jgi:hypothetical protein|tara:strand:- start:763 stop:1023 length:261 start_codon:yes stop_codon:yes gene_type:complete